MIFIDIILTFCKKCSLRRLQPIDLKHVFRNERTEGECCGKDLYRLTEIATAKDVENKDKDWDVKIDVTIARQIRKIKPKTESFKDAVNKILADWLSCNHQIPGGKVMAKACNP